MHYSKVERETTVSFDESCRMARVYTSSPRVMRQLDKLTEAHPETYRCIWREDGGTAARYIISDYRYLRFSGPRKTPEAQKAALEAMKAARIDSRSVSGP